ncbi:sensor histidine kinase [Saccharomonospora cyanea]|uniref:sensor histidine kinase n=1 Tax=Saccharomonospora cyanea TaxID=40989 RepID=UPI0018DEE0F2|nr:histidine kinase [Saccharomonospora cyanea]
MTSYVAATTYRRPRHLVIYTAAASLLAVLPRPGTDVASSLGSAPLFVWLPLMIGLWTAARGQVVAGLRERAERLEREQAARAEQARAHERARIARDMHDVIAHRVSLMVLRAGALEINATDDKTAAEAELIRTTGKEALTQLRAVLGVLDEADQEVLRPQPVLADLDWLLDQSRSVGVAVERRDEGTAGELPVMVQHTAYRVVQEALTNVHKYANTATAQVVLRYLPSALDVTVRNTAPSDRAPVMSGGGLGLVGLRERVEVLGGTFVARPEPDGGFIVSATLPT